MKAALLGCWAGVASLLPALLAQGPLQPVYQWREGPHESFITEQQFDFAQKKPRIEGVAFRAVLTNQWLPGLVPIFLIEKAGRAELRRLPPRGQENITEPFFFALPAEHEASNAAIAGHWRCEAWRADGSKAYPDFEIASDGARLAARFDQTTEYRFAFITEGSFVSNRLALKVEYIADRYELTGRHDGGRLAGEWIHAGGSEKGTWTAERDLPVFCPVEEHALAPLYEFRRDDGAVRYRFGDRAPGPEWKRANLPLARVWR